MPNRYLSPAADLWLDQYISEFENVNGVKMSRSVAITRLCSVVAKGDEKQ